MPKHLVTETLMLTRDGTLAVGSGLEYPMPYDARAVGMLGRLKTAPVGTTSLVLTVLGVSFGFLDFFDSPDATSTGMSTGTIARGTPVRLDTMAVGSVPGADLVVALSVARV
jgi:hypothetical protein